jgi:2-methylcitrate dehydratase PrpD
MKMLMLIGATIGFSLGLALGLAGRAEWPTVLWHSCAAAAGLGWLMRWWGRVWTSELRASLEQRRTLETAARQQTQSTAPTNK